MKLTSHPGAQGAIAEVITDSIVIQREQDAVSIMEEAFACGARQIILHQAQLPPEFFDLRTGLAGAVLQKFVNYNLRVAIVGDFSRYDSKSLAAFIYESNRGTQIFFVESLEQAVQKLNSSC